jgi:mRNA interferase HigB
MHVISIQKLRMFWLQNKESEKPLRVWYKLLEKSLAGNYMELKQTFNSADVIEDYTIFDVGGNKYRVIVQIYYQYGRAYIAEVLTHAQYDETSWKRRLGIKSK